jgi:hypothetical protein
MPYATLLSLHTGIKGIIIQGASSLLGGGGVSQFHALCMLVVKRNAYLKRNRFQPDVLKIFLSCCLKLYSHRILYLLIYLLLIEKLLIHAVRQAGCCKDLPAKAFQPGSPTHKNFQYLYGDREKEQATSFSRC